MLMVACVSCMNVQCNKCFSKTLICILLIELAWECLLIVPSIKAFDLDYTLNMYAAAAYGKIDTHINENLDLMQVTNIQHYHGFSNPVKL